MISYPEHRRLYSIYSGVFFVGGEMGPIVFADLHRLSASEYPNLLSYIMGSRLVNTENMPAV
jgi:hypothetical protein